MIYRNPRLKHVKKIEEVSNRMLMMHRMVDINGEETLLKVQIQSILDQCNLLLETKKKKKNKPSPQPEKKSAGALVTDCCGTEDFDPWGFDRGDGTYDERCGKCGKKTDVNWKEYPKVEPSPQPNDDGYYGASGAGTPHTSSPQPEIIKLDLMQVAHEANILGEDIESEIRDKTEEKINEVIDQLNKITKTK